MTCGTPRPTPIPYSMKSSLLKGATLLALATGFASQAAFGAAGNGDVLLGFRATAAPGASTNLVVNLGQASQFTTAPTSITTVTNINADLVATYGAGWATRTNIFWGIAGATGSFAAVGGDPANTTYASNTRPSASTAATGWDRSSNTVQSATTLKINSARSAFNASTAGINPNAVTQASSSGNSWSYHMTGSGVAGGTPFQTWGVTLEAQLSQQLDFFRMIPTSTAGLKGDHLVTFVIAGNGDVLAIPAGSAPAALGSGGTVVVSNPIIPVNSGSTSATVTLTRTNGLQAASVQISTANGTATAPADYTAISGQVVNFAYGQTSVNVPITLSGAALTATRVFSATISTPTNTIIGSPSVASIRIRSSTPDTTPPVLAITAPAANAIVKEPTTGTGTVKIEGTLNGTVGDPSIDTVTLSFNGGAPVAAAISTDKKKFSLTLIGAAAANAVLAFGNNSVVASGSDLDGNSGSSAARSFFYEALRNITTTITPAGSGVVAYSPALATGGKAAIGRTYTVIATANPGFYFGSWSGKPTGTSTSTSFTFADGDTVVANFLSSPFTTTVAGSYSGALKGSTTVTDTQGNAGLFTATVALNSGAFTGKVNLDGVISVIAGVFNPATRTFVSPIPNNGFAYSLVLDNTGPVNKVTGTITKRKRGADAGVISVDAAHAFSKTTVPTTGLAATYNVAFSVPTAPGTLLADERPHGNGFGSLVISATSGAAKMTGFLADGTAYTSSSVLCRDATVPVFASFLARVGSISGKLTIDLGASATDITGTGLRWFRSENKSQYYPWGYDTGLTVDAVGAKRTTSLPASLGLTGAPSVDFTDGPFSAAAVNKVLSGATTLVSSDGSTKVILNATTGLVTGEYKTPGKHLVRGIIVGKAGSGEAYGYILSPLPVHITGNGEGGLVTLNP
jgi:hypothetical protein